MTADPDIAVLQAIATFLRSLDADERRSLANGTSRITLEVRSERTKAPTRLSEAEVRDALARLDSVTSRDEATDVLRDVARNKSDLSAIARAIDLPVPKNDSVAKLRLRIVEAVVGFRIRSAAIRRSPSPHETE